MNLEKEYAGHIRKHLGYFPVWQPGDAVAPGDVGLIEHGSFRRQGSFSEVFPSLKASVDSITVKGLTSFRSEDCSAASLGASGSVPTHGTVTVSPSLRLTFGSAGGAVFDALDCTERYISNLLEICTYVDRHRQDWPPHLKLATRITDAKRFVVLISAANGASVDLSGDAKALGSWNLADASIKISNEKNVGYEKTGNGPILVGLYGFGWFGTHLKVLSATEKMAPEAEFKELPARDHAFD
jgi:hypothetical protein